MNAVRQIDDCARYDHSIEPYLDGELDAGHTMDVEGHLRQCAVCSDRVDLARATRASLKRCAAMKATDALRARVCASIAKEKAHECAVQASLGGPKDAEPSLIRLRYAVALAAAAGVAFAFGVSRVSSESASTASAPRSTAAASVDGFDTMLDDLVAQHVDPLPPETTNPEELKRFDPFVGVAVRGPQLQPFEANFKGARLLPMRDRRAAVLQYTVKGMHRVTLYVFDSRAMPVQATSLKPRVVRDRRQQQVYVGRLRGYSIAAAEEHGVGYALASDLNDDESAQLMVAAVQH
jgi:anti-sigma factor RsiW